VILPVSTSELIFTALHCDGTCNIKWYISFLYTRYYSVSIPIMNYLYTHIRDTNYRRIRIKFQIANSFCIHRVQREIIVISCLRHSFHSAGLWADNRTCVINDRSVSLSFSPYSAIVFIVWRMISENWTPVIRSVRMKCYTTRYESFVDRGKTYPRYLQSYG